MCRFASVAIVGFIVSVPLSLSAQTAKPKGTSPPVRFLDLLKKGQTVELTRSTLPAARSSRGTSPISTVGSGIRLIILTKQEAEIAQAEALRDEEERRRLLEQLTPTSRGRFDDLSGDHRRLAIEQMRRSSSSRRSSSRGTIYTVNTVGTDYVSLIRGSVEIFIPLHEIKRISRSIVPPKKTVADRLKTVIDVNFQRLPLRDAISFIGDKTGLSFVIDGDALKAEGYTQNMPQTLQLQQVDVKSALDAIVKQYDQMTIVIDEKGNRVIITTRAEATAKKLPGF